jgi:hypothetical protein
MYTGTFVDASFAVRKGRRFVQSQQDKADIDTENADFFK